MIILDAHQIKAWDNFTIQHEPISSIDLMERASFRCTEAIIKDAGEARFHVVCGPGNNGGDGLVIARMLLQKHYPVRISLLSFANNKSSALQINLQRVPQHLIQLIDDVNAFDLRPNEIIIDAIFGYGITRPITGNYAEIIKKINNAGAKVFSIDMPSGLFTDDNSQNCGAKVQADITYTFQCQKLPFLLASYHQFCGIVRIIDIGLNPFFLKELIPNRWLLTKLNLPKIKNRHKFSHKGNFGYGLLIGGERNMRGAVILSATAAYRSGIGKLSVSLPEKYLQKLNFELPEAMFLKVPPILSGITAIGIGPGLGNTANAKKKLETILQQRGELPLVLDADALNIISENTSLLTLCKQAIITPHLKEFKRLCGDFTTDEERIALQQAFTTKYEITIVLKGANTTISTTDGELIFNSTGNSGMATAGSGDVLSGIILSLLAQGYNQKDAACLGVFIHGKAADIALQSQSEESLIASDIISNIGAAFYACKNE